MSVASDHGIWQGAVERGLITRDQLEQCLADQRELRVAGEEVGIDQLLLKRGWIEARAVADLLRADAHRAAGVPSMRRYEVQERIGEGAGSVIYRAVDRELGRAVALKVLREDAHAEAMCKRFMREAQSVARLSHPNIVTVYDVGVEDGRMYIVMELVEGRPLDKLMERRGLKTGELLAILEKVARGVQHAHDNGIVHRDLKPANILVTPAGEPKVVDFGLAHVVGEGGALTRTGVAVGTPLYMAPEQVRGAAGTITPRTDVYALGAILYEMLTGRTPHDGRTVAEIYHRICHEDPTPPSRRRAGVSPELDAVALKALEIAPERRYGSASEFGDDVARFRRGEPVQASAGGLSRAMRRVARRASGAWIAALAVVLGAAAWLLLRPVAPSPTVPTPRAADPTVDAMKLLDGARPLLDAAHRATYFADSDDAAIRSQVEQALQRIDRALAMAPSLASAHHERGRALEMIGRLREAESAWRRALELDGTMSASRYQLGRVLMVRAYLQTARPAIDPDEAKRLADEARQLLGAPGSLGDPLQKQLAEGMAAYASGESAAQRIVAEGLEKFRTAPGAEELHWLAGLCAPWGRQMAHFDAALAQRPKYALALYGRAQAAQSEGGVEKALVDLDAAIRLWPTFADAFLFRGYLRGQLKEWEAQAADFAVAERLDPGDLHVHLYRGIRLYDLGDFHGSVGEYTRVLDRAPNAATIWSNRGNSKSRLGDLDGAIDDHTESIRLVPHHNSYLNRASTYLRKGDRRAAMRDLDAALKLWPDYGDAMYLRAIILWEDGRREEGYAEMQRCLGKVILFPDAPKVAEEMRRALGK